MTVLWERGKVPVTRGAIGAKHVVAELPQVTGKDGKYRGEVIEIRSYQARNMSVIQHLY